MRMDIREFKLPSLGSPPNYGRDAWSVVDQRQAGSGKSTMMKHLFKAHQRKSTWSGSLCLGFFFNARGVEIERTPIGLCRTLLSQLLRQCPRLLCKLIPRYLEKKKTFGEKTSHWQLSELQDFFHEAISSPNLPTIDVFIDALDECNGDEVRRIVKPLNISASQALANGASLKMCWASRHYPHIRVDKVLELRLEDQNARDIEQYVRQGMTPFEEIDFGYDF
jgi:hypothetical protein